MEEAGWGLALLYPARSLLCSPILLSLDFLCGFDFWLQPCVIFPSQLGLFKHCSRRVAGAEFPVTRAPGISSCCLGSLPPWPVPLSQRLLRLLRQSAHCVGMGGVLLLRRPPHREPWEPLHAPCLCQCSREGRDEAWLCPPPNPCSWGGREARACELRLSAW